MVDTDISIIAAADSSTSTQNANKPENKPRRRKALIYQRVLG